MLRRTAGQSTCKQKVFLILVRNTLYRHLEVRSVVKKHHNHGEESSWPTELQSYGELTRRFDREKAACFNAEVWKAPDGERHGILLQIFDSMSANSGLLKITTLSL